MTFDWTKKPTDTDHPKPTKQASPGKSSTASADYGASHAALDRKLASDSGSALDPTIAGRARNAYATDMSSVRVHDDADANALTGELGYQAFAYGSDLFFSSGAYQPSTPSGQTVLLHELAHVAQTGGQRAGGVQGKLEVGTSDAPAEADADRAAAAAMAGQPYSVRPAALAVRGFGATGHGVTHENQTLRGAKDAGFNPRDAKMIYSGNWQRDMNQLLVPAVEDHAGSVYEVLNLLHTAHFGFPIGGSTETIADGSFSSAGGAVEFGTYDPVEHIDNPGGLTNEDVFSQAGDADSAHDPSRPTGDKTSYADADPRYLVEYQRMLEAGGGETGIENAADGIAHRVDQTGIPVYINAAGAQMKRRLSQGVHMAHAPSTDPVKYRDRALRFAGEALHIMQDYYAHSNFCEIAINLLLRTGTKTLGDDGETDTKQLTHQELFSRLRGFDSGAGAHNLDTYVHKRSEARGGHGDRDVNAQTRSGREVMGTGTFTLEDTAHSIKEKALAAIHGVKLFEAAKTGPSKTTIGALTWLENNPEFVGDTQKTIKTIAGIVDAGMPAIDRALQGAGIGLELWGQANAAIEREVGGGARRGWHELAGGVEGLFGDSPSHDAAAANADKTAENQARVAEADGRKARADVVQLRGQLTNVVTQLSNEGRGLSGLYTVMQGGYGLFTLAGFASRIPIVGPDLAPHVQAMVNEIKEAAKRALTAMWEAAKPQLIAEVSSAIALALGDTEVQHSDEHTGHTTSGTYTQPTHTDIAKDFDAHQHEAEDQVSILEEVGELVHHGPTSLFREQPHPHEHQQRHGGAWLADVAHSLATRATDAILTAYRVSLDESPTNMDKNIVAQNRVIDSWYAHPEDCRATWEATLAAKLNGEGATSHQLLAEIARRTAKPPAQQAPNDQQYADTPEHHDDHEHH